MNFQLVDAGWDNILKSALKADHACLRVVCPFIKERAARRLLEYGCPTTFQVITRYDLDGFVHGVSDIAALELLLGAGAEIRGIKNLHAKAYLIGASHAIVTSANLTEQALTRNHEFGFYAQEPAIVANCHGYFKNLWKRAGSSLSLSQLQRWSDLVAISLVSGSGTRLTPKLGDEGADVGLSPMPLDPPTWVESAAQGFIKFFGEGHNRESHDLPVIDEVDRAGCHWACTYPKGKKPRNVHDGAIMFMGRLVGKRNDTLIFGRAIGMQYLERRDDATDAEIKRRPWKAKWPRYVRVHDAKFVNGVLSDGVSLNDLMDTLGPNSFASTKKHKLEGSGNTNPRSAFNQQPAVELTPEAIAWLKERLDICFEQHGTISPATLEELDWPDYTVRAKLPR